MLNKITNGFVVQSFDSDTGKCVNQDFVAGDPVEWEDEEGNPVSEEDYDVEFECQPFNMVQPRDDVDHRIALQELANYCDTDSKRAVAYARMAHLLTPEQLRDVQNYVEENAV